MIIIYSKSLVVFNFKLTIKRIHKMRQLGQYNSILDFYFQIIIYKKRSKANINVTEIRKYNIT